MSPRLILLLLALAQTARADWGKDINPGAGPQLMALVKEELGAILRATPSARPDLIAACIQNHGEGRIEALKRFRNPELKELFLALLGHENWKVRHRALLALESYADPAVIDLALPLLAHPERRLREKAAITLLKLWDGRAAPEGWEGVRGRERDVHVRACLEALELRMRGRLPVERLTEEKLARADNGLLYVPFLSGLTEKGSPVARSGSGSASRLPPAPLWNTPLLGFGEEVVEGTSLQPFANRRGGGSIYHTGQDVGASLDGAGFYASAEGIVKLIHAGSDMGTLIVLEHALPGRDLVCSLSMHGGDTVFVKAGDRVVCGQLLGTMGLSFSRENGGHYAHLHFGLYPGAFDMTHNYGYRAVSAGLADWYDPALFLPQWMERTRPLVVELRPVCRALARYAEQVARGEYAAAHEAAVSLRQRADPGSEEHVDATYIADETAKAPANALERARRILAMGYPSDARDELKLQARLLRAIPGSEGLGRALDEWERDPLVRKALRGEKQVERALRANDAALLAKLRTEYADTCLAARLR